MSRSNRAHSCNSISPSNIARTFFPSSPPSFKPVQQAFSGYRHRTTKNMQPPNLYIVALFTNRDHLDQLSRLRERYFPAHLNQVGLAHITLFHALPESSLESDVVPALSEVASNTDQFPLRTGKIVRMKKGFMMLLARDHGDEEVRSVRQQLHKTWLDKGILSEQDAQPSYRPHYTLMNKENDPDKVDNAIDEISHDWRGDEGTALGLHLFKYTHKQWIFKRSFLFKPGLHEITAADQEVENLAKAAAEKADAARKQMKQP